MLPSALGVISLLAYENVIFKGKFKIRDRNFILWEQKVTF